MAVINYDQLINLISSHQLLLVKFQLWNHFSRFSLLFILKKPFSVSDKRAALWTFWVLIWVLEKRRHSWSSLQFQVMPFELFRTNRFECSLTDKYFKCILKGLLKITFFQFSQIRKRTVLIFVIRATNVQ